MEYHGHEAVDLADIDDRRPAGVITIEEAHPMSREASSRAEDERISEAIRGLGGKDLTTFDFAKAFVEAGIIEGTVIEGAIGEGVVQVRARDQAAFERVIRGLIRRHNRHCERTGDYKRVFFQVTTRDGKTVRVREA